VLARPSECGDMQSHNNSIVSVLMPCLSHLRSHRSSSKTVHAALAQGGYSRQPRGSDGAEFRSRSLFYACRIVVLLTPDGIVTLWNKPAEVRRSSDAMMAGHKDVWYQSLCGFMSSKAKECGRGILSSDSRAGHIYITRMLSSSAGYSMKFDRARLSAPSPRSAQNRQRCLS
jgi:hypothetical protein